MPICPAGHDSATSDYCDVCGALMQGMSNPTPSLATAQGGGKRDTCPDCGTPQTGRFCEECGHDFIDGTTATRAPHTKIVPGRAETGPWSRNWTAVAVADRAYFDSIVNKGGPDADAIDFPAYCPERRFPLVSSQIRIGRRSASRGITPEVDLTGPPQDPGVSHLHALLIAQSDGSWALVDLGSTNGTLINDATEPVERNVLIPLREGDRIHLGAWTTITLHAE
jgi:hypothetical protein